MHTYQTLPEVALPEVALPEETLPEVTLPEVGPFNIEKESAPSFIARMAHLHSSTFLYDCIGINQNNLLFFAFNFLYL